MKELEIMKILSNTDDKHTEDFLKNTEGSLKVKSDYEKIVEDIEWIDVMETTIPYIDNILRNPNRFIINEEEIVKIELARKITVDSIKHLSKNTNLIQDIDEETGDVRPSKILNVNKEECYDTYENRMIYSLIKNMTYFISRRKKAMEQRQEVKGRNDKKIEYNATSKLANKKINVSMKLDSSLDSSASSADLVAERILILERKIMDLTCTEVYKIVDKRHPALVTSPIKKTNVILKNVNFQYAVKLWNYLQDNFDDKTGRINDSKDYEDKGSLRGLIDETFLLQFLAINSIDEDKLENKEKKEKLNDQTINLMLQKIVEMDSDLTKQQLQDMLTEKYAVIKYKNQASIREIQNIFKEHIAKYLKQIK